MIKLVDFRTRQLQRALEALSQALEFHHRSLERLESALIEFEETLTGREDRQERPRPYAKEEKQEEDLISSRSRRSARG